MQLQSDNPDLRFAYAEEGCPLFTDNMMMPAKVEHPYAAETMMNYVYDPEVAATIAAYVNYISPVKGVKEVLEKKDPKLAKNPLIFPPEDVAKRLHPYPALSPKDEQTMQEAMAKVTGGVTRDAAAVAAQTPAAAALAVPRPGPAVADRVLRDPAGQPAQRVAAERRRRRRATRSRGTFSVYTNAISDYSTQFLRSIGYSATATILCLIIGFPLAYFTAFKAGQATRT